MTKKVEEIVEFLILKKSCMPGLENIYFLNYK
jgi:hypothetical protein